MQAKLLVYFKYRYFSNEALHHSQLQRYAYSNSGKFRKIECYGVMFFPAEFYTGKRNAKQHMSAIILLQKIHTLT